MPQSGSLHVLSTLGKKNLSIQGDEEGIKDLICTVMLNLSGQAGNSWTNDTEEFGICTMSIEIWDNLQ